MLAETGLPAVELKGSMFTLTVLRIQSLDLEALERELKRLLAQGPRFFENAPVVLDLEHLKERSKDLDFPGLTRLSRRLRLIPVGVRNATPELRVDAAKAGLAVMKGGAIQDLPSTKQSGGPSSVPPDTADPTDPGEATGHKTKVVTQTVRSGQQVYAAGGDLILLAAVNAGAEVVADGHIHVYAPLRGRALAGVRGDTGARIFCQSMEAELVGIAGHYQIFEEEMPEALHRATVQVCFTDDQLKVIPLVRRSVKAPDGGGS